MKKKDNKKHNLPWLLICIIGLVIIFFSIRLIITYDSAHYLNYVAIFEGKLPTSSWDIVRGPIFPALIYLFNIIFGKMSAGILIGTFLFYLLFSFICYKICENLFRNLKHKKIIQNITLSILILNPLILGYFHVLLTEFVAITLTMLNILMSYKWIYIDTKNKRQLTLYLFYFIFSLIFCYHLKQPFIIISFVPPLVATIISIIQKHSFKNISYRIGTLIMSILFLFISIAIWDKILIKMNVDMNTGRDSSSLLSQELLKAYQIHYDNDGDGKNDPVSTTEAIGILFQNFISNPSKIINIYINNYCGLTSICVINSSDGVNYSSSSTFAGIKTFENTSIGYRTYSNLSNIFMMPENLHENAIMYGESSDRSFFATIMNIFEIPTNILFKISAVLCMPILIILIFIKIKYKNNKNSPLFLLSLLLLITAFSHLAISDGIGLIIDRYAIEAFIPSLLGILGSIIYIKTTTSNKTKKHLKLTKKSTI